MVRAKTLGVLLIPVLLLAIFSTLPHAHGLTTVKGDRGLIINVYDPNDWIYDPYVYIYEIDGSWYIEILPMSSPVSAIYLDGNDVSTGYSGEIAVGSPISITLAIYDSCAGTDVYHDFVITVRDGGDIEISYSPPDSGCDFPEVEVYSVNEEGSGEIIYPVIDNESLAGPTYYEIQGGYLVMFLPISAVENYVVTASWASWGSAPEPQTVTVTETVTATMTETVTVTETYYNYTEKVITEPHIINPWDALSESQKIIILAGTGLFLFLLLVIAAAAVSKRPK